MNYIDIHTNAYPISENDILNIYSPEFPSGFDKDIAISLGFYPVIETQKPDNSFETVPECISGVYYQTWEQNKRYELIYNEDGSYGYKIYDSHNNCVVTQLQDPENPNLSLSLSSAIIKANKVLEFMSVPSVLDNRIEVVQEISKIGHVEFMSRLTDEELFLFLQLEETTKYLYSESVKNGSMDPNIESLYKFFYIWNKASYIDLEYGPTIYGITKIGHLLCMSDERISAIINK